MEFEKIVHERYAVKRFDGKVVPESKVEALKEIIRFAPTSFNLQPWKVKVITDRALLEKLQSFAWNQLQICTCSHLFIFCANTDLDQLAHHLESSMAGQSVMKEKTAAFMEMIWGFLKKLDAPARLNWAQRQTYIALTNGLNGAKALGFDSCPMEGFEPEAFSKELDLPKHLVPTVLMPIGFSKDAPQPKIRFPNDQMFF
jgi:nitroreductase / dihydropteridine reductase